MRKSFGNFTSPETLINLYSDRSFEDEEQEEYYSANDSDDSQE
jgi:hypothetical protein